jgi:predicted DNA-binding protein (MmcQ/YjbR family)
MNIEEVRDYCLNKKGVTEEFPFDEKTLVFKVLGKMFLLSGLEHQPPKINLKCNPEKAIELREEFDGLIYGGYHMSKKHWNTIEISSLPSQFIIDLIDHSYDLVVAKMPVKLRKTLQEL